MIQNDIHLEKLELYINNLLKIDIYKNRNVEHCPICNCKSYIKYGSYNGIQRYKCKKCDKTFSNATNSLWSYSKKNAKLWIEFLELMLEQKSLRFCAEKLKINLVTAFYWRHKILQGLALSTTPATLKGVVFMSKTIMKESFKGCKNIEIELKNQNYRRRNIWIISAKGDEDSMFVRPVFKDFWDWKTFYDKIYPKIEKKSYIVPYGDRYIEVAAKKHNKKRVMAIKSDDDRIKYFILNLKTWFGVYHGIATKYLTRYLNLFVLFHLDRIIGYMNIMHYDLFSGNRFIKTNKLRIIDNYMY